MADPGARELKLTQYLNEAYGKEKQLETTLQAQIGLAKAAARKTLQKRLQDHLKETKAQSRGLERRIKQLGGKAEAGPISSGPDMLTEAATGLTSVASKAVAVAQGPIHALRGTGEAEKMLKNARTEYHNEFEEIGFYAGIASLADTVGDKDTAKLARSIRREEERMAKFLEKQIDQLAKAVAREEIPASERNGGSSRRRSSSRRSSSSSRSSSNGSSRTKSGSSRAKSSSTRAKSSSSRAKSSSSRAKSGSTRAKSSSSRAKSSTSRAKSGSTRAKSGSTRAKSSGSRSGGSRSKTSSRSR